LRDGRTTTTAGAPRYCREATYEMRLRFEAIPFRRMMMMNTIATNMTPATTRTILGSIETLLYI